MYNHLKFVDRVANWQRAARQMQIDQVALEEIWASQAAAGTSPEFVDVGDVSADELRAAVETSSDFGKFLTGAAAVETRDRRPSTVPFIQERLG